MTKKEIQRHVKEWFNTISANEKMLVLNVTDVTYSDELLVYVVSCDTRFPATSIFRYEVWFDTRSELVVNFEIYQLDECRD